MLIYIVSMSNARIYTRAVCGQCTRDLKTRADLATFLVQFVHNSPVYSCFAICSEYRYSPEEHQNHCKIWKVGYDAGENGLDLRQRQLRKINEAQAGER